MVNDTNPGGSGGTATGFFGDWYANGGSPVAARPAPTTAATDRPGDRRPVRRRRQELRALVRRHHPDPGLGRRAGQPGQAHPGDLERARRHRDNDGTRHLRRHRVQVLAAGLPADAAAPALELADGGLHAGQPGAVGDRHEPGPGHASLTGQGFKVKVADDACGSKEARATSPSTARTSPSRAPPSRCACPAGSAPQLQLQPTPDPVRPDRRFHRVSGRASRRRAQPLPGTADEADRAVAALTGSAPDRQVVRIAPPVSHCDQARSSRRSPGRAAWSGRWRSGS